MQIPRPSQQDKDFFTSVLPADPEVEVKPMFGNLGAFVHGNMFAGLYGPAIGVKLSDADMQELAGIEGSGPYGPDERPMGGYLSLPAAWRAKPDLAASWIARALTHVASMPPKVSKPARKKA